jgi:short-subunit dehydrogenase
VRIFITGVSSGIGKSLAKHLISRGHEVWGIARRTRLLEELANDISSPSFRFDSCDIANPEDVGRLHLKMEQENYLPDVVVLNAAIDLEDHSPGLDFSNGSQMMRTNVDGAFFWICRFIEPFLQRGSGQFIGVSSIFAHWPDGACVAYSASKAALSMLFRGLRIRYNKSRLQFKLVYLGPVNTSINPRFDNSTSEIDSPIIATPEATAEYIAKSINSRRHNFYFPFYISIIFFTLRWLPDKAFEFLTGRFRR